MTDRMSDELFVGFKRYGIMPSLRPLLDEAVRAREAEKRLEKSFDNIQSQCCDLLDELGPIHDFVDKNYPDEKDAIEVMIKQDIDLGRHSYLIEKLEKENAELKKQHREDRDFVIEAGVRIGGLQEETAGLKKVNEQLTANSNFAMDKASKLAIENKQLKEDLGNCLADRM